MARPRVIDREAVLQAAEIAVGRDAVIERRVRLDSEKIQAALEAAQAPAE
jgi:hypothetical protein